MADTVYLGSGKVVDGRHGEFFSITLNLNKVKDNPQVVEEFKGVKYIRLNVSKKEQKDKFGKDVSVTWGQYKEDTNSSSNSKEEKKEDFPF